MARKPLHELKAGELDIREFRIITKGGQVRYIINHMECEADPEAPGGLRLFGAVQNITHRKWTEERQILFLKILDTLNQTKEKGDLIRKIFYLLKDHTGIEAVGIRLREGEDFPYYETNGFPMNFVAAERFLCARNPDGQIIRDAQGNSYLECMCGNVICGRTDPSLPFFTENGSFWTNSTSQLLAVTSEKDLQAKTRERFRQERYESVALIPLRSENEIIGLLQLNDKKPNQFSLDGIKFFEGIGASIGIALARKQAEEALQESEGKYRNIFENALEGIFQTTTEGRFLTVNPALARMYGYDSPEELINSITDLEGQIYVNPEKRREYIRNLEEKGEVKGFEVQMRRKDGTPFWVSNNGRTVRDLTGKILYYEGISEEITQRLESERKLKESVGNLRKAMGGIIQVLSGTVEIRDPYTAGHQRRVADLARTIAQEMGLADEQREGLRMAGIIHDLGKVSVPAEILTKPTKLSDIEYKLIQAHPQIGYDILKEIEFPWPIADTVLQHHERLNGSGYPRGLKGEAISLEARILMVADVVEAMASYRPYRPGLGVDAALEEIEKNKGILYDPEVVEVCLTLFKEKRLRFE